MRSSVRRLGVPASFLCALLLVLCRNGPAQERQDPENYCVRCHDAHGGLDLQLYTCMRCHESVPYGQMGLYPWYSSEAALAGIRCRDCHEQFCRGDSCLSCHSRHSDPLR